MPQLKFFAETLLRNTGVFGQAVFFLYKRLRYAYDSVKFEVAWLLKGREITSINWFERWIYSQNGEDGILQAIFRQIGTTNRFFVEFGVEDGTQCNTRLLRQKGWSGIMMDGSDNDPSRGVKKEFITAENINRLFKKYHVPNEFDLLGIDLDGNDYWVWKDIENSPRVVVIEYNSGFKLGESKVIKYDPGFRWDNTNYFGASLLALVKLGRKKGYTLVGCDNNGINAFFVRDDLIRGNFRVRRLEKLYRQFRHGKMFKGARIAQTLSNRKFLEV